MPILPSCTKPPLLIFYRQACVLPLQLPLPLLLSLSRSLLSPLFQPLFLQLLYQFKLTLRKATLCLLFTETRRWTLRTLTELAT